MKLKLARIVSGVLGFTVLAVLTPTQQLVYAADPTPSLIETLEPEAKRAREAAGALQTMEAPSEELQTVTARVLAVNPATRELKVQGPDGKRLKVMAGPEVQNLDQMKIGDEITVKYQDATLLSLQKGTSVARKGEVAMGAFRAETGSMPRGGVMRTVDLIATVEGIDQASRVVTLKGLEMSTGPGRAMQPVEDTEDTIALTAPDNVNLAEIQIGDKVRATYRQRVAISAEPTALRKY